MNVSTFLYLCGTLAPDLQRQDTNMRLTIPIHMKVVVSISRLAIGNFMQCIADLYMIGLSSSQQVVSQFCVAIKISFSKKLSSGCLLPLFIDMHKSFKTCIKFCTWWGWSMTPTYPSLHPDCMLVIITTSKDYIQSCCRA